MAVASGNVRLADELLKAGANINGKDDPDALIKLKPLLVAVKMGQMRAVELLVDRGADLEAAVVREELDDDGEVLFPKGSRALHVAVYCDQAVLARFLLKAGCKPDVVDSNGASPLMLAHNSAPMFRELLSGGADAAFAGGNGVVPLHVCAKNDTPEEVMDLLLEAAPSTLNQVMRPPHL